MQDIYDNNPPDALEQIFQGPLNWINLIIIGLNILVFIVMELTGSTNDIEYMLTWGAAYTPAILEGEWYRLVTSMFLHFGIAHIFNNMFLLLFMGDMLEEYVGKVRFFFIYMLGGIMGNVISLLWELHTGQMHVSAGASGAVFAVIGGVLIVVIKNRGRIKDISVKRLVIMIVLTIYYGFQSTGIDNAAHIGGIISGIILTLLLYKNKVSYEEYEW